MVSLSPPHLPRWVNHSQERKVGEAERKEGARAFTSWRRTGATFAVKEETAAARWPPAQPTGQKWSISHSASQAERQAALLLRVGGVRPVLRQRHRPLPFLLARLPPSCTAWAAWKGRQLVCQIFGANVGDKWHNLVKMFKQKRDATSNWNSNPQHCSLEPKHMS